MKRLVFSLLIILISFAGFAHNSISLKGKIKVSETKKVWVNNYNKSVSDTVRLNWFRRFKYSNVFSECELLFVRPLESFIPLVFSIGKESSLKIKTELPDIYTNLKVKGNNETFVASEFYNRMSQFKYRITETEQKLYTEETADGMYFYDSVLVDSDSKR